MHKTFSYIIFFLIIIAGIIALQIFLSKKQNKWLGLILPFICLILSINPVLGITSFSTFTVTEQSVSENGEVISNVINSTTNKGDIPSIIITVISVFLLYNIPTVVLLAIYYACRENLKRNKELEKMNIQDLE